MKQDSDFQILREYGAAIKKFGGKRPATQQELDEFTRITQPFLRRLQENMGHSLADSLGLLRAVFNAQKEKPCGPTGK